MTVIQIYINVKKNVHFLICFCLFVFFFCAFVTLTRVKYTQQMQTTSLKQILK